jgi:16S rRNA (uracil1498-N3)-methyltransferase
MHVDSRTFAALPCLLARRRFFIDRIHNDHADLTGDDARHLARVLRAEPGQRYELSDNHRTYLAEISSVTAARVTFHVLETLPAPPPSPQITLYAALIKFDRFEWLLEKATELGVAHLVPVIADRIEKGLASAAPKRIERWRRITRESSQQSRRWRIPEIQLPEPFSTAVADPSPHRFLLEENPGAPRLLAALPTEADTFSVLTGPEGGWTDRERALASDAGWKPVSLGANILRAETAAIAALAILGQVGNVPS